MNIEHVSLARNPVNQLTFELIAKIDISMILCLSIYCRQQRKMTVAKSYVQYSKLHWNNWLYDKSLKIKILATFLFQMHAYNERNLGRIL